MLMKLRALSACARQLEKLLRVAVFFFQPVVKKQGPQRGLKNISEVRLKVKRPHFGAVCYFAWSGRPANRRSDSASFAVFADVTSVTAKPNTSFASSSAVSGNTVCSLIPNV